MPPFVSVHTLCASRNVCFNRDAHARDDSDVINYAINHATKLKVKFSYCDLIKFNKPVLEPGIQ